MKRLMAFLGFSVLVFTFFASCDKDVEYKDIVEDCTNGIDDDGDGFVDCDDQDCFATDPACMQEICNDGIDNDGDGLVDCVDSTDCTRDGTPLSEEELRAADDLLSLGCSIYSKVCGKSGQSCFIAEDITIECPNNGGMGVCADDLICVCVAEEVSTLEDCDDGVDNDGDGFVDCIDKDCQHASVCKVGQECAGVGTVCPMGADEEGNAITCPSEGGASVAGVCAESSFCVCPYFETTVDPEVCDDGQDNDGDGDVDCDDSDCSEADECQPGVENCADGVDNDGDGDVDCDDSECVDATNCQTTNPEVCNDSVDNDGDGDVDCDDSDCAGNANCQTVTETICNDGVDNDGDGNVDCDDTDCDAAAVCQTTTTEDCTNGIDDDGDGSIDCVDASCDGHARCAGYTNECASGDAVGDVCFPGFGKTCGANGVCAQYDSDNDGLLDCVCP